VLAFPVCDIINVFIEQGLQVKYTLDPRVRQTKIHLSVIKTRLTKELETLVRGVYEEVVESCNQYIPVEDGTFLSEHSQFNDGS